MSRATLSFSAACFAGLLLLLAPEHAGAQQPVPSASTRDSVTVEAGSHYNSSGLHHFLFGGTYRHLWTTPIRVPVLDLQHFAGGLTADKAGGGQQTKSLRFTSKDGAEYIFRSVDKDHVAVPEAFKDVGIARRTARDQISNSHPAANIAVPPLLEAAGVLHDTPVLVVMPDDPQLGKFRKEFAHRLGGISRYPRKVEVDAYGFSGAVDIIDSDTLLQRLNRDPAERVDVPAFLAARLMDMLVNNWDRHPGQWKWARAEAAPGSAWEPISRDYDKAFISVEGLLPSISRLMSANLMTFDSSYPAMRGLTWNSLQLDRRLLNGLSKPVWDSVAIATARRITDGVIDASVHAMPAEYRASMPVLIAKLRARRDSLPQVADRFYHYLAGVVDIHATDASDRATITPIDDRYVELRITDGSGETSFLRRFDARETTAIRLYLHGAGDDALVRGSARSSIPIRIIGGNGTNQLLDSAVVGGRHHTVPLYDVGTVSGVSYGVDTLWNRRPLVYRAGGPVVAGKDYGSRTSPTIGLSLNRDLGVTPRLGMAWTHYGFRKEPYASRVTLEGRYSLKVHGALVALGYDRRRESSALHWTGLAQMSQLELVNYHGLGNTSPQTEGRLAGVSAPRNDFYAVSQRQWLLRPAVALGLSQSTELSFGPVLQYAVTDSTPGRFVSATRPYGFSHFGEAGVRLALLHDNRVPKRHARRGTVLDLSASYFPAVWDVQSAFGSVSALAAVYVTLPLPLHPYLGLRAGGKKVFGNFPFQEAAFLGGRNDVRTLDLQRYAGDASLYGTAELRVPVAKFTLLLPLNVGLLATEDIGRVYVKGVSPFGWHNAFGAGFWVGFQELTLDIRVMRANESGHAGVIALRYAP